MSPIPLLTPPRRHGSEILDGPDLDPRVVRRSMRDVARANTLFGGASALLAELEPALGDLPLMATLLDVGTGIGDIPARARHRAWAHGVQLRTIGVDISPELAAASAARMDAVVCADALRLPFGDDSFDVVTCSQLLHHFPGTTGVALLREMDRVARVWCVVSDLRRSWTGAAGLWLASFPLLFHPISRHDGVVSVLRGFTPPELRALVREAVGADVPVCRRLGFRVTTSWEPR